MGIYTSHYTMMITRYAQCLHIPVSGSAKLCSSDSLRKREGEMFLICQLLSCLLQDHIEMVDQYVYKNWLYDSYITIPRIPALMIQTHNESHLFDHLTSDP